MMGQDHDGRMLHEKIVCELLELLEEKSYYLKLSKTQFEVESMDLLGWRIGNGEIRIDPDKVVGIKEWPQHLKNVKQVRSVLGVAAPSRPRVVLTKVHNTCRCASRGLVTRLWAGHMGPRWSVRRSVAGSSW